MHIDWFVLFCQILNFLLLIYLLKRFLYGRIIKAMDDREAKIAARFAEADEMKVKATEEAAVYERRNQLLNETKEKMFNEATMAAEAKRAELMGKVREDVDVIKKRWKDMLIREQEAFFFDLRKRATKQIYLAARRALTDLADADLEERIVHEFIRRIRELDQEKSVQIRQAIHGGGNKVTIQSAFELPVSTQGKIEKALNQQITNGFSIRYIMDPGVISGIEMRVNGHKVAWSLNEYLENIVESMSEALQREAYSG